VQLTRWLAKPRCDQHGRHLRPRDALLADRKQPLAQTLKPGSAPQGKRQIHIAKLTWALDADALQPHRHRQLLAAIIEQLRALGSTDQPVSQRSCLHATVLIEFAELRPDVQHARCAQGANSDEPCHPCVSRCDADTCARINPTRRFLKIP